MKPDLPIYLDNHATTRCDPRVLEAMWPAFGEVYGNAASRGHRFGTDAKRLVETARAQVAALVGATAKEVVWTSGATEADNLAIAGAVRAAGGGHLVTVATEHKAVLDTCAALEREGVEVTRLPVDSTGRLALDDVRQALRPDTVLLSAMAVNNEVGVVHPLADLGAICRERGVLFHVDAAQAGAVLPLDIRAQQIDLLSLSAHKMYGPKGIGALIVRRGRPRVRLAPLIHGGGHERGLRSGTLPVPLIVGMGAAAALAGEDLAAGAPAHLAALRGHLYAGLCAALDGVVLNGPPLDERAANNLNVTFEGVEAEALIMGLRDIAVSTGSACTSATLEPSHVLRAMGLDAERAHASIRFGLGRFNTRDEIDHVVARVAAVVPELRALAPLYLLDPA